LADAVNADQRNDIEEMDEMAQREGAEVKMRNDVNKQPRANREGELIRERHVEADVNRADRFDAKFEESNRKVCILSPDTI